MIDLPSDGPVERGAFPCRTARIAVDTVWEHARDLFGGDTHATATYDTILMAAISEIYDRDLNMHLAVPYLRVWASDTDPYNVAADDVLGQFRNHWNANMGHISRTLAHIFTNEGLNGAGGVAWGSVVCHNSFGYAASGYLGGSFPYPLGDFNAGNWDLVVAAHEMGHNFGADHTHSLNPPVDGCGNGDCSQPVGGTIMSYCHTCAGGMTNLVLHFHERNLTQMNAYMLSVGSCPLINQAYPTPDYASTIQGAPVTIDVLANDNIGSCGVWNIFSFPTTSLFGGTIARSVGAGAGGRDELLYTPTPEFAGIDRFSYTVQMPGRANQVANVTARVVQPRRPVTVAHPTSGATAAYYALSQPTVMPDFSQLTPFRSTLASAVNFPSTNGNFASSGRADEVGAVFTGYIQAPATGAYTLSIESDDGSRLFLGDTLVIDHDGLHGMEERTANVVLAAGMHPIRVEFFENGGGRGVHRPLVVGHDRAPGDPAGAMVPRGCSAAWTGTSRAPSTARTSSTSSRASSRETPTSTRPEQRTRRTSSTSLRRSSSDAEVMSAASLSGKRSGGRCSAEDAEERRVRPWVGLAPALFPGPPRFFWMERLFLGGCSATPHRAVLYTRRPPNGVAMKNLRLFTSVL